MLGCTNDVYPLGVGMVLNAIENFARDKELLAVEQDQGKGGYYSSPTAGDLEVARWKNVRLVDPSMTQELLVKEFAELGKEEEWREALEEAVRDWYGSILEQPHLEWATG